MPDESPPPKTEPNLPPAPPIDPPAARAAAERWGVWNGPRPGTPYRPPYSLKAMD